MWVLRFKRQWLALTLGSALAASALGISTAAAVAHIYPSTGYSSHTREINWYDYCIGQQYNYGHLSYAPYTDITHRRRCKFNSRKHGQDGKPLRITILSGALYG